MMDMWRVLRPYYQLARKIYGDGPGPIQNIQRYATTTIIMAAMMLTSLQASAISLYRDGTMSVDVNDIGRGTVFANSDATALNMKGHFNVEVLGYLTGDSYAYRCFSRVEEYKGEEYTSSELAANNGAILRQQYYAHMATVKIHTDQTDECQALANQNASITEIRLSQYGTDTETLGGTKHLKYAAINIVTNEKPTLPDDQAQCAMSVGAVSYGTIRPSANNLPQDANVEVRCDKAGQITVTTNKGNDYTDANSGTTLRFRDPGTVTCLTCRLPIHIDMVSGPKSAGSYSWQVPVVVNIQ